MLALDTTDTWDGLSLHFPLLSGTYCPFYGDFDTWTGGPWTHFFDGCLEACHILSSTPDLAWILLLSTSVSSGFALFTADSPFVAAVHRILTFVTSHGDISLAGVGTQLP